MGPGDHLMPKILAKIRACRPCIKNLTELPPQTTGRWKATGHPTIGGGTQDTDFNKRFTKGIFTKIFGEDFGGVRGHCSPLIYDKQDHQLL